MKNKRHQIQEECDQSEKSSWVRDAIENEKSDGFSKHTVYFLKTSYS